MIRLHEAVKAAFDEACAWLTDHSNEAEGAGIDVDEIVQNTCDETEK